MWMQENAGDSDEDLAGRDVDGGHSDEDLKGEDMFILRCDPSNTKDPRQVAERHIAALSEKLNQKPTLPLQYQNLSTGREGYDLPLWHCSFRGCGYAAESGKMLKDHIPTSHAGTFRELCGQGVKEQDMLDMYAAAITRQCQSGAPVANVSIDRRALRSYRYSLDANNISCLLCYCLHAKISICQNQP